VSDVKTLKSLTHTDTTQTGLNLAAKYQTNGAQVSGSFSHRWGSTDQDRRDTQTDSSRELRERNSTTTSLSQLYNLLSAYHPGTNRAVFMMLPRPHTLQPTDRRTFAQGFASSRACRTSS
jgi:hypothetical protein